VEGDTPFGVGASPPTSERALGSAEWCHAQTVEEPTCDGLLVAAETPPDLLDGDGAGPRLGPGASKARNPVSQRTSPQRVDEDRGVEQDSGHGSPGAARVASALGTNPAGNVVVPVVSGVLDLAERGLDVVPPTFVLEPAPDQLGDEGTALASPDALIELLHELVVERYVQTHVPRIAHNGDAMLRLMKMRAAAVVLVLAALVGACSSDDSADDEAAEPEQATTTTVLEGEAGGDDAGDPYVPGFGATGYDVQDYDVHLRWQPPNRVIGEATITLTPDENLSELALDLDGLRARTVTVDGEEAEVEQDGI
jgi:hypothetical protein